MKAEKHDARTVCLVESASGKKEAWFQDEVPVGAVVVMCMSFGEYTRIRREEEARLRSGRSSVAAEHEKLIR